MSAISNPYLVTVRETVLSTYRVDASDPYIAMQRYAEGQVINRAFETLSGTAIGAEQDAQPQDFVVHRQEWINESLRVKAKSREEALEIAYKTPGDEWEWVKSFTDTYEAAEVK